MGRLFAIPDIHGRRDLLELLLAKLRDEYGLDLTVDKLIFLGDMVDRGPDSKGVIDIIRALKLAHPDNVIVLRGNHEDFMIEAMAFGRMADWMLWTLKQNGGMETLKSFGAGGGLYGDKGIPKEYIEWAWNLPLFHEEPGFFFSHAPVPKEKDRKEKFKGKPYEPDELNWTYFSDERGKSAHLKDKDGNPVVGVCGHIHRLERGIFCPRYYKNYLFLDAGCGCHKKAPLVCTEVRSRTPITI